MLDLGGARLGRWIARRACRARLPALGTMSASSAETRNIIIFSWSNGRQFHTFHLDGKSRPPFTRDRAALRDGERCRASAD